MEHVGAGAAPSDRLRDVYDRRAALEYASPPAAPDPRLDRKYERMLQLVAAALPAPSLLDAGCGDGRYLAGVAGLSGRPGRLVGVDISGRILATAAQTLRRVGAEAELVRANLEHLPFADNSFERVFSVQALEHLLAPERGLSELARVLTPGGLLVLSTDNSLNYVSRALNLPRTAAVRALGLRGRRRLVEFPHRSFRQTAIVDLVQRVGLETEQVETFRFHLDAPLAQPLIVRMLAALDRGLPQHGWGDLIALVATKPGVSGKSEQVS